MNTSTYERGDSPTTEITLADGSWLTISERTHRQIKASVASGIDKFCLSECGTEFRALAVVKMRAEYVRSVETSKRRVYNPIISSIPSPYVLQ